MTQLAVRTHATQTRLHVYWCILAKNIFARAKGERRRFMSVSPQRTRVRLMKQAKGLKSTFFCAASEYFIFLLSTAN